MNFVNFFNIIPNPLFLLVSIGSIRWLA